MQIYNTLTRKKEPFVPVTPGKVGMYACGITTYDLCHIGHGRSAVVFDVLARYLRSLGLAVTFVRNFTDVDDKIINRAIKEGAEGKAIAERCADISRTYIAAFHEDMDLLGVQRADIEPKATEHIEEMIALCQTLIGQGHAYATPSGDVYFKVRSFAQYGKLSGRSLDEMQAGARVAPGEEKQDPMDFALWKGAKPGEPSWPSPWGQGRPGWHIECSAMTEKHLPLPLDIHGGGQDLVFPHHENELAQTEAATQKEFARYWVHNGFVQINAEKMSKSLGNFTTLRDIYKTHLPEVLRFFLLARHYRSPIDFTAEAMEDAEKNCKRMYETLQALQAELAKPEPKGGTAPKELEDEAASLMRQWDEAMADDLNTAAALGYMNSMGHLINRMLDDKGLRKNAGARQVLVHLGQAFAKASVVLGLLSQQPTTFLQALRSIKAARMNLDIAQVEALMQQRLEARTSKDFARSDAIRDVLAELGVAVRDTPEGALWDIA